MKQLLPFLISFFCYVSLTAQHTHHRVRIDLSQHSLQELSRLKLGIDHGHHVAGEYLLSDVEDSALPRLRDAGVPYQIVIPDVGEWYARRNERASVRSTDCEETTTYPYDSPENYQAGSMGGYFTYEEMLAELEQMAELYPDLITAPEVISDFTSVRGRPIHWIRLSDQAQTDETEPEVLYTALHHAREPNSLSQMIYFMWYLLENYGQDPEVTYLVNETELYFIPCINPDGYIFNQENYPNGGGLWRKNLSEISGAPFGVDLNRNYGYEWGFDDFGSSPEPNSPVYRGDAPFSEPETQAVKYFSEQHEFQIVLNYHTFGNLLIHPWGYNDEPTEEDPIFKGLASVMTAQNDYTVGTATETVGYIVNGNSDDWMYGEQESKPKAYAYTPEVGSGAVGFWPPASDIEQLNKSCLWQNLSAAYLLHHYVQVSDYPNQRLSQQQGVFELEVQRFGLSPGTVTVQALPGSPNVEVQSSPQSYQLGMLEESSYSFNYAITPGEALIEPVYFALQFDDGAFVRTDTLKLEYINGELTVLSSDSASVNSAWNASEGWDITTEDFTSAPSSWTDSPGEDYPPSAFNTLSRTQAVSLTGGEQYLLQFSARWALEKDYDFAQLLISTDNENWQALCGRFTQTGDGFILPAEPLYTGIQQAWVKEEIDLSAYAGQEVYFQFRLQSDNFIELDGYYFDDFEILSVNASPTNSSAAAPLNEDIRVYPNPVSDWLFVETTAGASGSIQELQLVNSLGKIAIQQRQHTRPTGQWKIWMGDLPGGIYFLQYRVDGKTAAVRRVVK